MTKSTDIEALGLEDLRRAYADLLNANAELRRENETMSMQMGVLAADNDALAAENSRAQQDISELTAELRETREKLERANEVLNLMERKIFGRSSEKSDRKGRGDGGAEGGEVGAFNEAERDAARQKGKKKRRPRRKVDYSALDREVVEHGIPEADRACPSCGSAMDDIGYDVKYELKYEPARLVVVEHRIRKYVCRACSRANAAGRDEDVAVSMARAQAPSLPLGNSHAGPSLLAHILHQKYALSVPIARIWGELDAKHHLPDRRNTVSGWVTRCHERWFAKVHALMRAEIAARDLVHIDETSVVCLEERRKAANGSAKGSSKSYMWVFCTAECGERPVYAFVFGPSRGREVLDRVLPATWTGAVVTDDYSVYRNLPSDRFTRVACGVHIRRYFVRAAAANPKNEKIYSAAQEGVDRINRIFHIEHEIQKEHAGDFARIAEERARLLRPEMDSFLEWAKERREGYALPGTKLCEALDYSISNWPAFENCLEDGRYPLTNNRAERAIRPFCIGRRNWLFCDSSYGAEASAAIYSIVTTARANGLDDERYMEWLLTEMPKAEADGTLDELLPDLMPWSDAVPDRCRSKGEADIFADDPVVDVDPTDYDED